MMRTLIDMSEIGEQEEWDKMLKRRLSMDWCVRTILEEGDH